MSTMFRCNRCNKTRWGNVQKHSCGECEKKQKCSSCGGLLVQMTEEEIQAHHQQQKVRALAEAQEARESSILPKWCLSAISMRAYEDGHSAGEQEVAGIEVGMISEFEEAMRKEKSS